MTGSHRLPARIEPQLPPRAGRSAAPVAPAPSRVAAALFVVALLCRSATPSAASNTSGAPDRDRYLDLLHRERQLERLNAAYKLETELSAKRTAYAVLSLSERRLYFKVRGRAFKAITMTGIEATRRSRPVDSEDLAGRVYTLQVKEGKGVETESIHLSKMTPEEAARAGGTDVDVAAPGAEQGEIAEGAAKPRTAGTGAPPVTNRIEGVAGGAIPPDPPPRYHMGFDGDLSVWVIADMPPDPKGAPYELFLGWAKAVGRFFAPGAPDEDQVRLTFHMPLDKGQQIFREILPGQRMIILP